MVMTVKQVENENNVEMVEVTTTEKLPRFVGKLVNIADFITDSEIDFIKENCKVFVNIRRDEYNIKGLHNFDIDDEELPGNVSGDFEVFEKKIQEEYKDKYNCYYLVAHIHGGISFCINGTSSGSCPWDSGCVGFIALPKDEKEFGTLMTNPDKLASYLTALYMGDVFEYQVYDKLNEDIIDSYTVIGDDTEVNDWKESTKTKFNIDWSKVEPQY